MPASLAFCRLASDAVAQRKQVVDIDAIDDGGFGSLRLCSHDGSPLFGVGLDFTFGLLQRRECLLDALALFFSDQAGQHLAELRMLGA